MKIPLVWRLKWFWAGVCSVFGPARSVEAELGDMTRCADEILRREAGLKRLGRNGSTC